MLLLGSSRCRAPFFENTDYSDPAGAIIYPNMTVMLCHTLHRFLAALMSYVYNLNAYCVDERPKPQSPQQLTTSVSVQG